MKKNENKTIIENRGYFRPDEVVMSQVAEDEHVAVAVYEPEASYRPYCN